MAYGNTPFFGPTIPGRFVNGPQDISPAEVPTNGDLSLFPSADYTKIYARQRSQNGMIMEVTFVPERPPELPQNQPQQQETQVDVAKSLEVINQRLDKMEKQIRNNRYRNNSHRKEKTDE